jgi:EmrB/QacA subfamily drug resistance transporter
MRRAANTEQAGRSAQRWVLAVTAVASLMVVLDALVVSTALTTIRVDLHASVQQLEWTVNAYTLSFAVLLMTGATLGDRFGRRHVFCIGVGLFAAASAACALSPTAAWLITARALQGAGAALVMPLALALLGAAFAPADRPKALGIFAGASGLAVSLGPLIGGAVVEGLSWQWIFWLNVPVGLAVIALARRHVPEGFGPRAEPDPLGLALVTAGAFAIVWGLVRGNPAGWGSVEVLAALTIGVVLAVAFVGWELRTAAPMLEVRLFGSRRFTAGNVASFFHWGSAFGALYLMAQFLQTGLGYGPLDAGLRLMPWGAVTVVAARVAGGLIARFGERPFIAIGMTLNAAALATIALIAEPKMAYWPIGALLAISGAGVAMSLPAGQSAVLTSVPPRELGMASGAFSTMRQLGGAFGVAVLVAVFAGAGSYASPTAFIDGFAPALGVCAALAALAALAGLALGRRHAPAVELGGVGPAPARAVAASMPSTTT